MPRHRRLHLPDGTYYVVQFGSARQPLFAHSEHYALFEDILDAALKRTGTRALAYCWLPLEVHLALKIGSVPLGRLMQGVSGRYARALHVRTREAGHLFAHRHRAVLIDPARWLLPLIRYLHFLPVTAGTASTPDAYRYTSHHAYLGRRSLNWLNTTIARRLLEENGDANVGYAELMARPPSTEEVRRFKAGGDTDPRVIGNGAFVASLPRRARTPRSRVSLEQLIQSVARMMEVEPAELLSRSRKRQPALARAVIAWHATERGIATLSEVASRLRRDPATLSLAIARHQSRRPELFRLDAFRYLAPLG